MAYLQQDKDDKEKVQGLNEVMAPQEGQAPVTAAASQPTPSAPQASSAPAAAQPGQVNQKAGSGTFTNLKNYLTANQGNRISSAATQKVSNLATGAQKGITQASTGFGQKVEQGTLANREQAVQDVAATTAAARGVEAIAPAPVATPAATPPVAQAADATAPVTPVAPTAPVEQAQPQYLDDAQQKRFADIINAKYAGPESLRQSGLLQPAAEKVTTAARQIKNVETAGGREELLRSMYGKNRDYTQGQSKLDALLLNTSGQGVSQLQEAAKAGGNLQQTLQQAEAGSQNLAQNRAQEISGIREEARKTFGSGRKDEEDATEKRITDLIKTPVLDEAGNQILRQDGEPMTEWDRLPEHFRNSLANKASGTQKVKEEQLAAINTQYAPQIKAMTDATSKSAALDKQIKALQQKAISLNMGSSTFGEAYSNPGPKTLQARAAVNDQLHTLQQQSAQQKAEVAALQQSPEYQQYSQQKSAADKMNMNQWALSPEEAAVLGVSAGEGLYNIGQGDIRTVAADREKLITQNEFARQQALSQLAGLDLSKGLQKELLYKNQAKAGTQDLTKSLDTESFRNELNQREQGFRDYAKSANITGSGSKKNKTSGKRYYANESANLGDVLKKAGYDFEAPMSTQVGNTDILNASKGGVDYDQDFGAKDFESSSLLGSLGQNIKPNVDLSQATSPYTDSSNLARKAGYAAADYGSMGITAGLRALGLDTTGALMSGVDSVFGSNIFGGSSSKESKSDAARMARTDLQNKIKQRISESGFENRANIADTETTRARTAALNQLLQRKG